ncbi:MAG: hypothetical protein K1W38_23355, partial [Lachnospiraceae bacterium]
RALDIRKLTREGIDTLPRWNIISMDLPDEGFFSDLICSPYILMSRECIRAVTMYQPDIVYKGVKLWESDSGVNRTYFLAIIEELDCMSKETQRSAMGNRIIRLVLDEEKIGSNAVFRIKGCDKSCIVVRLDVVESLLRRGVQGITLEEVQLV